MDWIGGVIGVVLFVFITGWWLYWEERNSREMNERINRDAEAKLKL